jgi:hypothetical protein
MRSCLAHMIVCMCFPIVALSQKPYSIQVGGGATSMSWLSFTIEAKIHAFDKESLVQALAVSTGYGIPMFNAAFVPLDLHGLFFQGSNHVDVTVGANIQVNYKQPNDDGWRDLQSSLVNPTASLSYRYESEDGGFCFRIGLGAMYAVHDARFTPQIVIGYGWTF